MGFLLTLFAGCPSIIGKAGGLPYKRPTDEDHRRAWTKFPARCDRRGARTSGGGHIQGHCIIVLISGRSSFSCPHHPQKILDLLVDRHLWIPVREQRFARYSTSRRQIITMVLSDLVALPEGQGIHRSAPLNRGLLLNHHLLYRAQVGDESLHVGG